jgi:hypothetical protein
MEALTCPKCGAPLQIGINACPYCRVGLTGGPAPAESPVESASPPAAVELPPGWKIFHDPWLGFTIAHPPGWEVSTFQGQTTIKGDPVGFTSAGIAPFSSPTPTTARAMALQFVNLGRQTMRDFQAWQQGNASADSNRITIRTRANRFGQVIEGIYNILVEGQNCIISGYNAPPQSLQPLGNVMAKILSTFRTTGQQLPRQIVREPMEGAFTLQIPAGWTFQGRVNRNNIGGAGSLQFSSGRDPQGTVMLSMPSYTWAFIEPMMALFSFPGGYPSLGFMTASKFAAQWVMGQLHKLRPDAQLVSAVERPDLAEIGQWELLRSGYPLGTFETSVAMMEGIYTENGLRFREKSRVSVMRQPGQAMWNGLIDMVYRAPEPELETWEPVLTGSFNSMQISPQWQAGERGLAQNYINNAQADIHRRQQQISQTLSETSDIISNSYWNRQATYDRISEMQSNVTLGVQNVASDSGDVYKVPNGYDRYWVDGLGNTFGGSWLSQPDINWQPLNPTGI